MLCPVGDAAAMGEAIAELLANRKAWERASLASYQRAEGKYSFEQHADRLEEVYREILEDE